MLDERFKKFMWTNDSKNNSNWQDKLFNQQEILQIVSDIEKLK